MRFFDWLFGRSLEDAAEKPKGDQPETKPATDPIGYGTQVDPLTGTDRKSPMAVIAAALRTAQEQGRQARYTDFDRMDKGDVAAMLTAVLDAVLTFDDVATGRGFKLECDQRRPEQILQAAAKVIADLGVVDEAGADLLKYGDCFGEPVFYKKALYSVQMYNPKEMIVNRDDKGKFPRGKDDSGFPAAYQQKRNGQTVAGWFPWEMIHGKFMPSTKLTYSVKGLLDDIRADWRKLELVEIGMVTARLTRAYPRRVRTIDQTGRSRDDQERAIKNHVNRQSGRAFGVRQLNDDGLPTADVSQDLFISTGYIHGPDSKLYPLLNDVRTEDPAIAGLAELGDVEYLRAKVWSVIPADIVGIRRNTSGEVDAQDIAYSRLLRRVQTRLEAFLRGIFDQVLLANGYLPSKVVYRIVFPTVTVGAAWKHADARFRSSMTLRNLLEMGIISRRYALKRIDNLSDREVDEIWEEILEEAQDPRFQLQLAPARNGQPSMGDDPKGVLTGAVNKAGVDGDGPAPTAPDEGVIPATGAAPGKATTKNGIDRGTKLGQRLRGNMSGG